MGDEDERRARFLAPAGEVIEDQPSRARVDASGRLVGEEERRGGHERPGHRRELSLSPREPSGERAGTPGEAEPAEDQRDALPLLVARPPLRGEGQRDVLLDREVREEVVELKDDSDVRRPPLLRGPQRRGRPAVEEDLARVGLVEKREEREKGRLPATGRPGQGEAFPGPDVEVDAVERVDEPPFERLPQGAGDDLDSTSSRLLSESSQRDRGPDAHGPLRGAERAEESREGGNGGPLEDDRERKVRGKEPGRLHRADTGPTRSGRARARRSGPRPPRR